MPVNLYQIIWIFLIYALAGWCCEVSFAAVELGKFVNRGFLNGPVCPIYGVGMLVVLTVLWPLKENLILLFLGAALLTTLLELVTGYILEKFFHEKWWDYSDMPFNFKGYICLKFTLIWGMAATFVVAVVHKFIYFLIQKTPLPLGITLIAVFGAIFLLDFTVTLIELLKLPKKLNAMLELESALKKMSNTLGENISETTIAAAAKGNELLQENKPKLNELKAEYEKKKAEYKKLTESKSFVHNRILKAFPNLKKGKYKDVFERLNSFKAYMTERIRDEKNSL